MLKIVKMCISNPSKDKFLFLKRNKFPFISYFGMPGGKIKDNEEPGDASSRELFEECGIVSKGIFLGKCHEIILEEDRKLLELEIYFFHFIVDEDVQFNSGNEGEVKWISVEEFKENKLIPSDPLMIDAFLNKGLKEVESIIEQKGKEYFQKNFEENSNTVKEIKIIKPKFEAAMLLFNNGEIKTGNNLTIMDVAYGEEEINEPVLIELINSKPVQRLKKISQYGVPDEYYHKNNFSRYDHSIGVLILLRRLGADLKEQIAGLLHDISHSAFSHVIDWAIGDSTKEDFQDNNHLNVLKDSEIPLILKKYGFDCNEISNLEKFFLLEKEAPSLCADRVDYTLRELDKDGFDIDFFLKNLINKDNSMVFRSLEPAEKFAYEYLRLQNEHWAGPQAKVRYFILGSILRRALEIRLITVEELISYTDMDIIRKLEESPDNLIIRNLELLKNGLIIKETKKMDGVLLKKKFRYIDPEVLVNGEIKKVSELSREYALILENEKNNSVIEKRYIHNAILP